MDVPVVSPLRSGPTPATITVISPQSTELALGLTLEINVVHSKRDHCPRCGNRRVLYHLAAWVKGQPAGAGNAMCAKCAGFRMAGTP
jgi:DNA-directed RNA polymerase subunit M/transcription elongation factor TFIIS